MPRKKAASPEDEAKKDGVEPEETNEDAESPDESEQSEEAPAVKKKGELPSDYTDEIKSFRGVLLFGVVQTEEGYRVYKGNSWITGPFKSEGEATNIATRMSSKDPDLQQAKAEHEKEKSEAKANRG